MSHFCENRSDVFITVHVVRKSRILYPNGKIAFFWDKAPGVTLFPNLLRLLGFEIHKLHVSYYDVLQSYRFYPDFFISLNGLTYALSAVIFLLGNLFLSEILSEFLLLLQFTTKIHDVDIPNGLA